jgi:hypothetical protein
MAVARKSDISTTGGWFQRRTPRSKSANVQSGSESNRCPSSDVPKTQPKAPSPKNLPARNSNKVVTNTSVPNPNRRSAVGGSAESFPSERSANGHAEASPRQGRTRTLSRSSTGESPVINKNKNSRLPLMPSNESGPVWLMRLQILNRHSSVLAFLMVATMLVVYGWTVYSQQLWSQSSKRLQSLQRQERQLMATDAALKEEMAKEAQKAPNGLVSPTPGNMIFLPPSASGSANQIPSTLGQNTETEQRTSTPVGY